MFSSKKSLFIFISALFFLTLSHSVSAQSDQKEFQEWLKQREAGQQKQAEEFKNFLSARDKEFSGFLKQRWKEFEAFSGIKLYEEEKPVALPTVETPKPPGKTPDPVVIPVVKVPEEKPLVVAPVETPKKDETEYTIRFYDQTLKVKVPQQTAKIAFKSGQGEKTFGENWEVMAKAVDPNFLKEIQSLKGYLRLNDWAYGIFVQKMAQAIYPNPNSVLFSWFILNKSGLKTKLGYNGQGTYLLINPQATIYGMPYYRLGQGDEKYYVVADFSEPYKLKVSKIKTYSGNYPERQSGYDLRMQKMPLLKNSRPLNGKVTVPFKGKDFVISYTLNKNLLDLMQSMPQSDFSVYYSALAGDTFTNTMMKSLKEVTDKMSETDKINFLLSLSQKSVAYKTDTDQFGKEVYMFPEQVFFYPASDCDDRVSLFSYLVRSLTGNKIVYLLYPNHIAAAVAMKTNVKGDTVRFNGATYVVADPTYIGAGVGMTMPNFKNVNPNIFAVN